MNLAKRLLDFFQDATDGDEAERLRRSAEAYAYRLSMDGDVVELTGEIISRESRPKPQSLRRPYVAGLGPKD